jgi:hypothetical protein
VKLSPTEVALVQKLAEEGVIKPPTIKFATAEHSFVFTPKPGKTRLNAANREIYERAMALISAVRKGQLLPDLIKIRLPVRILEVLRDQGYIRATTEARDQYRNLVVLRVVILKTKAVHNHRISALSIDVDLHTEESFKDLGRTIDPAFPADSCYQASVDRWNAVYDCYAANKWSEPLFNLARNSVPLTKSPWGVSCSWLLRSHSELA